MPDFWKNTFFSFFHCANVDLIGCVYCVCFVPNRPPIARFYYIINFFPIQFLWAFIRSKFDFPLLRLYRKLNVLICVCIYVYMVIWMCACELIRSSSFLAVFNFIWNCSNRQKNVSAICNFKINRHSLEIQHR